MKVYIEIVMLDNLVVTSCIAIMAYVALGMRVHKFRTAFAAIVGTIISISYPYWDISLPLMIIAKIAVGSLLGIILFLKLEKSLLGIFVFFVQSAAICGLCMFAQYLIAGDGAMPYALPSCIAGAACFILCAIMRIARKKRTEAKYRFEAEITLRGKTARMKGYLDTGNSLYDDSTFLPIIVVKLSSLEKAFGRAAIISSISGYKRIETASGSGRIFLIKPEDFRLYSDGVMNKNRDVILGITEREFLRKEDMLLHPAVMGG